MRKRNGRTFGVDANDAVDRDPDESLGAALATVERGIR